MAPNWKESIVGINLLQRGEKTVSGTVSGKNLAESFEEKSVSFDSRWVVEKRDFSVLVDVEFSQSNLDKVFDALVGVVVLWVFD